MGAGEGIDFEDSCQEVDTAAWRKDFEHRKFKALSPGIATSLRLEQVCARLSSFQGESAVFALTLTGQLDNDRIIVAERLITVELAPAKTSFSRQRLAEPLPASVQLSSEPRQCKLAESEHHRDERPKGDGRRPRVDSLQARDGSEAGR